MTSAWQVPETIASKVVLVSWVATKQAPRTAVSIISSGERPFLLVSSTEFCLTTQRADLCSLQWKVVS